MSLNSQEPVVEMDSMGPELKAGYLGSEKDSFFKLILVKTLSRNDR